jgi:hypothetical protein
LYRSSRAKACCAGTGRPAWCAAHHLTQLHSNSASHAVFYRHTGLLPGRASSKPTDSTKCGGRPSWHSWCVLYQYAR